MALTKRHAFAYDHRAFSPLYSNTAVQCSQGVVFCAAVQGEAQVISWAEAPIKIARMTLTIKLDRNWNSLQLANSAPPLGITDSAIAPMDLSER